LNWLHPAETLEEVEGDLAELYGYWYRQGGKRQAHRRYWWGVLSVLPPLVRSRPLKNGYPSTPLLIMPMLRNYFLLAWRNLLRHRVSAFINLFGLAVGMVVAMLIGLWVYDELTFNRNHEHYESIVKVYHQKTRGEEVRTNDNHVTGLGTLLGTTYGNHFKRVVMVRARIEDRVVAYGDKKFTQSGYFMQPAGPEMLTLDMVSGSRQGLADMKSILLSETVAAKLFGDKDPVNQIVKMDAKWDLLVTGVYRDLPKNSEFAEATYLAPLDLYLDGWARLDAWDNNHMYIYAQLHPGADYRRVSAQIKDAMLPHVDEEGRKMNPRVFLLPMRDWHLHSKFENGRPVTSEALQFVRLYGIIGAFVLLLACINFMNLSTARSWARAREVGIRKTIGSRRRQLVGQFLSESVLVAGLSFVLALLLMQLVLPWFNEVAGKEMRIPWTNPWFWAACLGFTLLTGLLAGSYPALYLSSFNPIKVLKGTLRAGRYAAVPRKVLVTFQFAVSIALLIGTLVVYRQIEHAKNRPVGYSREGLVTLRPQSPEYSGKYQVLRETLKGTGTVLEAAQADYPLTNTKGSNSGFAWKGKDPRMEPDPTFNTVHVTPEYGKTVGWEFVAGRDFSRDRATDKQGVIITESAAKAMNLANPVGELLRSPEWMGGKHYEVLGVIKDMVKGSPFEPTVPAILFLSEDDMEYLFIRLKPDASAARALPQLERVFKTLIPSAPFDYKFADAEYALKFAAEERVGKLAGVFAVLTIFISCLGLFGLASFMVEYRTKEIGIRKVMGASLGHLWQLLAREYVYLVLLAFLAAAPVAYYGLNAWLDRYPYRTNLSGWVFTAAGVGALVITVLVVSYQVVKAALANPVKSLRAE
jgi:hypothetical protein